jgi:hypothetical protein
MFTSSRSRSRRVRAYPVLLGLVISVTVASAGCARNSPGGGVWLSPQEPLVVRD